MDTLFIIIGIAMCFIIGLAIIWNTYFMQDDEDYQVLRFIRKKK